MIKTPNPKQPQHRYFDTRVIARNLAGGDVDTISSGSTMEYIDFAKAYAAYVVLRTKSFYAK